MSNFVAIDFETANHSRNSACAVGLVHVQDGGIVAEKTFLIRPPQRDFVFTHVHGITWGDVKHQPTFAELWSDIDAFISRAEFLVAHHAPFDRGVLKSCCEEYGLEMPSTPFVCTVKLARKQWAIYPTKLPNVCEHLGIELQHHDAGSDSLACAKIVIAAELDGWQF